MSASAGHLFVFEGRALRVCLSILRKERFALPMKKGGCHDQKLTRDIEVEFLHESHINDELVGDVRDGNLRDIHLMGLNKIKQKV